MSVWTYIQGSVCLETSPYRLKKNKDNFYKIDKKPHITASFYEGRYLPFGKEQMTVGFPEVRIETDREDKMTGAHLDYTINLTSYPIIKAAVDKYVKDMPEGEEGLFYSLIKYCRVKCSSSYCESQHVEDLFYEHLKEVNNDHTWPGITKKELNKYFPSEIDWICINTESILTIHDSVRYCTASQMYQALIIFFNNLIKNDIDFSDGILAFNDYSNYYTMRFNHNQITVEIKEHKEKPRTEYWQVFSKWHFIRDSEHELKKVDEFKKYSECNDDSESQKEMAEYKVKYEPEEDSEEK